MLAILADHPRFLLVDKPAGLSFHREAEAPGLLDLLRESSGRDDLHAVHRLDRITSGLVLVAKGPAAAAEFGALFAERRIAKFYLALSDRAPSKKQGTIAGDMAKGRNGSWRLLPTRQDPAVTRFFSAGLGGGLRLFLVRPQTGRTHQIRVALKSLGSPILGDARYGGAAADRGYLHAWSLAFALGGERFEFSCPPCDGEHWHGEACRALLDRGAGGRFAEPAVLAWPGG